jgi:hypothetical protein
VEQLDAGVNRNGAKGNGTDRKEVDRKWTRASGQEESEQEIERIRSGKKEE